MAQIGGYPNRPKSLGSPPARQSSSAHGRFGLLSVATATAPYGTLAIVVWVLIGAGAICLGLTFAKLARLRPETGGPYAYTRIAYGDFTGFLIAWVYWISIWASLPVIAVAFAGAIIDMFPGLHSRIMAAVLTLGAIWAVVLINLRGVKAAGLFAELMTYPKWSVRRDRDHWVVLHRSDAFQRVQRQRQTPAVCDSSLRTIDDVCLSRTRIGDRPGRRCERPGANHPALNHPRHLIAMFSMCSGPSRSWESCPRAAGEIGGTFLRCGPDTLGPWGNRDLHRRYPVVDWRAQWLDAPHGPSADGGSARRAVPAPLLPILRARCAGCRDHRLGDLVDCPGVDPGRRDLRDSSHFILWSSV